MLIELIRKILEYVNDPNDVMGIQELQVANMEAAPFMSSLLSPAARTEFELRNEPVRPRRNPTRKCRK